MDVNIKVATEKDLAELLPYVRAYHDFEDINLTDSQRESSVRQLLTDRSLGVIWLVYGDNKLVGYLALCVGYSIEFGGVDAFLDEFYIHPEFREKGIGTRSLELVKEEARKIGIRAIHLEVARSNIKANNIYSRLNFKAREKYVLMSVNL